MTGPRILATLGMIAALGAPSTALAAAAPGSFYGYVEATDTTASTTNKQDVDYDTWPDGVAAWTGSETAESSGPTTSELPGATYRVSSRASEVVRPTVVGGNLVAVDVEVRARVTTSVSGCSENDRECRASGTAVTEAEFDFQFDTPTRMTLSGSLTAGLGDPSPDSIRCRLNLIGVDVAEGQFFDDCATTSASQTSAYALDQVLPAGHYRLDLEVSVWSNAYPWTSSGFAGVNGSLRLEFDAEDDPEDPGDEDVDFDWTVPDGYGFDESAPAGLTDSYAPDGTLDVDRAFPVDLVAEGTAPCDAGRTRTWSIDGVPAEGSAAEPTACGLRYAFPEEGVYEITLDVREADGTLVGSKTRDVVVQDWLIVSIGDSVASGEGNPDIPSTGLLGAAEQWQDQQCHRTALAGPAVAARLIEAADPKTSVTFIHLACSGATIASGLIGPYTGLEAGDALPPQLDDLVALTGGREIDAITVSIGANDVHFADVVEQCLKQVNCDIDRPGKAARFFRQMATHLPAWYGDLQAGFSQRQLDTSRVFITQYFDPTRTDSGAVCPDGTLLGDTPLPSFQPWKITQAEAAWASGDMLVRLDQEVRAGAAAHGWTFVDGIRAPFLQHGYCAQGSWVVRLTESFATQGDKNGTLHPNVAGHAVYGDRIAASLTPALYDDGDLSKPRPPAE